jgi:hypothetical protein
MIVMILIALLAVSLATCMILVMTYYSLNIWELSGATQDILCRILAKGAHQGCYPAELIRSKFNDLNIVPVKAAKNHTHGESAADRSSASDFMDVLGATLGLEPFFFQRSRADERNHRDGSRVHYWVKDTTAQPTSLPDHLNDRLVCIVDVDQYLDMPNLLVWYFQPFILYTFQPEQVARISTEYSYTFSRQNIVTYYVTGGATYTHEVWTYGGDSLKVTYSIMGVPLAVATYLIDRRKTSDDHELILLTPLFRYFLPFSALTGILHAPTLQRLKPVVGPYLRLEVHSQKGVFMSTGRVDKFFSATIPADVDDTLAAISRSSKFDLNMQQVASHVDGDKIMAAALLEYHRAQYPDKAPVIFPVAESVRRYQFEPRSFDPEAKPSLVPFMSPFLHECYAPDQTLGNEKQCVRGRILEIQNPTELKMSKFLRKVMIEFIEQFLPQRGQLHPVGHDEVWTKQNSPSQRRILEDASFYGDTVKRVCQMFIKKEAYANPNDPRPISTINGVDKLNYSRYIYALADYIKTQPWYAFGRTPKDIAQQVATVCSNALSVDLTDFSRFDGRVTSILRELESLIFMRAFHHRYHVELLELHRSQFCLEAFGSLGTFYETHYIRLSGSPETAAMNSLANAFVAFLARRMEFKGGFCDAVTSYKRLGIYGGDDGLTADLDPVIYKRAAEMVGQVLTVDVILRGELGVKFLARCYGPDVWFGDYNSCCDLKRQLSKFHTAKSLPPSITPAIKLIEKCRAFVLTDSNTPIMGRYCRTVLSMFYHYENTPLQNLHIWGADVEVENQYPNEPREFYLDVAISQMPTMDIVNFTLWMDNVCHLDMNPESYTPTGKWNHILKPDLLPCGLTRAQCMLFSPPLLCAPTKPGLPKKSVIVDDELYTAENDRPYEEIKLPERPSSAQRQNMRAGKRSKKTGR